ncbi:ion transporter [Microbacterium sp. YY-03]|uniref:ion transporter n=1 Tax=Microbacterium sp. YY-03 TaxID=3421636 RepID=UPI003D163D0F
MKTWYSRTSVNNFVTSKAAQNFVLVVIIINAIILGLETVHALMERYETVMHVLDKICLWIFIVEIALKLYGQGLGFFRNAWNVFDFVIVGIALIPGADGLAVLRALRVLRVLRLISVVPSLRRVVDALVKAVPGIASIAALLGIMFYVGAVMATMLFGKKFPAEYGDLGSSLFSLFQIMTLDGWSDQVRKIMLVEPAAPAFFVPFVLISALTVLNLFIAVIVDAMQGLDSSQEGAAAPQSAEASEPAEASVKPTARDKQDHVNFEHSHHVMFGGTDVAGELAALRQQVEALTAALAKTD